MAFRWNFFIMCDYTKNTCFKNIFGNDNKTSEIFELQASRLSLETDCFLFEWSSEMESTYKQKLTSVN